MRKVKHYFFAYLAIIVLSFAVSHPTDLSFEFEDTLLSEETFEQQFDHDKEEMYKAITEDTAWVDQLIEYFRIGDEKIDLRDNATDIVIVLGWTGVGKSTITQVVAGNEGNPLDVQCNENEDCWIIDQNGTISDNETIISETFLPNMVLDIDHNEPTAFYDCPGFGDTRSVTVEIANAYYMKKVADHGQNIKIVIIALHPDFDNSYRDRLPQLFKKLVQFIRNVDHYSAGFSFIVNKKEGTKGDFAQINTYRDAFINLGRQLENFTDWTADEKESAQSIIDSVIQENANSSKIWFFPFPEPRRPGPVDSFQNLMDAKINISELIWGKSQYIIPTPGQTDFGFALTGDAILQLLDAVKVFDHRIVENAVGISTNIVESCIHLLDEISRGDYTNFPKLQEKVSKLNALRLPTYTPGRNLVEFMNDIVGNMTDIVGEEQTENLNQLLKFVDYLKFILDIEPNNSVHASPQNWVTPFLSIRQNVSSYAFSGLYQQIRNNSYDALLQLTPRINSKLSGIVSDLLNVADQQTKAEEFRTNSSEVDSSLSLIFTTNTTLTLHDFLNKYIESYIAKLECNNDDLSPISEFLDIINVIELLGLVEWRLGLDWLKPVKDVFIGMDIELSFIKFVASLFTELADSPVQVDYKGQLHYWRTHNPVVTEANFPAFWSKFTETGITAVTIADSDKINQYLVGNSLGFGNLNKLLDYTLKRNIATTACPSAAAGQIIFEENYLTMSYILQCLQNVQAGTKVIVTAIGKIFFDSNPNLVASPISLFVMSTALEISNGYSLILSGSDGPAPVPSKLPGRGGEAGSPGSNGTSGSDFYGIYHEHNRDLNVYTCGGSGSGGQGGADGSDGDSGMPRTFTDVSNDIIPESQCAAWADASEEEGNIQVRLYPNSCNGAGGINDRCHAGNNGVWVTIDGTGGQPGQVGGAGGAGGSGGAGGRVFKLSLQSQTSTPTYQRGLNGPNGQAGLTGEEGRRGSSGPGTRYRIDDVMSSGKRCKIEEYGFLLHTSSVAEEIYLDNSQNAVELAKTSQNHYSPSAECSLPETISDFSIEQFRINWEQFVIKAESNYNIFVYHKLMSFVGKIKLSSVLQ